MMTIFDEINSQMAELSSLVQVWINWMMILFGISVIFIRKNVAARFVLLAFLATMPSAFLIFYFFQNIHLFAIAHVIFWLPLLIYLFKFEIKSEFFNGKSFYGIWIYLLCITIGISLVFDFRDIVLVAMGKK